MFRRRSLVAAAVSVLTVVAGLAACSSNDDRSPGPQSPAEVRRAALKPVAMPRVTDQTPTEYPGIHNAVAYHEGFVSGSQPDGDAGFATLAAMGVRTIISVDGAEPDVEKAEAYGMTYVHLPIGYNGFNEERELQLARATRDAMNEGPVYIHCHHGKHRSAGAAAAIATTLGWETPDEGVARMKVSGTAPNYKGLYACAEEARAVDVATLDAVAAKFPSRWVPSGYVAAMIEIDEVFERLKDVQFAGWAAPKDHPDLVPVAEAGRLADLYRLLLKSDYVKTKGAGLAGMMTESQSRAQKLEEMLAASEKDPAKLSAQFKLVSASCKDCHSKHRD